MYTIINGLDFTDHIDPVTIKINMAMSDPLPVATFDVDGNASVSLAAMQSIVILDENGAASPPSINLVVDPQPLNFLADYQIVNPDSAEVGIGGNDPVVFSCSSTTMYNFITYLYQNTPPRVITPGQTYVLSGNCLCPSPIGCAGWLQLSYLDSAGNLINYPIQSLNNITTAGFYRNFSVSSVAPYNAAYAQIQFGLYVSAVGAGGSASWVNLQLEPATFASRGITYPTATIDSTQLNCTLLPDGTTCRQTRIFAGYINHFLANDDAEQNRTWQVTCGGPAQYLESTFLVNQSFTNQQDNAIVSTIMANLTGLISINNVHYGTTIDQITFDDISVREAMNGLCDSSGFNFYVDPYFDLHYEPLYYQVAPFVMSDEPDYVTAFPMVDYQLEVDATQLKNRVKVAGGKYIAPAITDTYSAPGGTPGPFAIFSQIPYAFNAVNAVISNGNAQKSFFSGSGPTLGQNGYTARIDKANKTITFSFNPAAGTNNLSVTYTYEAPVLVRESDLQSYATYGRFFDNKVNDTSLITPAVASLRGIAELVQYSTPRTIIRFSVDQPLMPGTTILVTYARDSFVNKPFIVQKTEITYDTPGETWYKVECGAYNPDLVDVMKNMHKSINRQTGTAGIPLTQDNLAVLEQVGYSDSISVTGTGLPHGKYGTAIYGQNSYH